MKRRKTAPLTLTIPPFTEPVAAAPTGVIAAGTGFAPGLLGPQPASAEHVSPPASFAAPVAPPPPSPSPAETAAPIVASYSVSAVFGPAMSAPPSIPDPAPQDSPAAPMPTGGGTAAVEGHPMTMTGYGATVEEPEASKAAPAPTSADRFADLGEHIRLILQASHEAAEEERRRGRLDAEALRAEVTEELSRRREELDGLVESANEQLRLAQEEASSILAAAQAEAERISAAARADNEAQLSSLLSLQESLRAQLVAASLELRRSLESLGAPEGSDPTAEVSSIG